MLRDDLAEARKVWLKEAKDDPQEYAQLQQSDFLAYANHEGVITDFHSLRHTFGAHPKVVQTVMRHQSITLTMDTYGHLFPGEDAVGRLGEMLFAPPEALQATGTADTPKGEQDAKRGERMRLNMTKEPSRRHKNNRPSP